MPKYYHVHRSPEKSSIEKKLVNYPLYFSKKNSYWYNVEKDVGINDYGGYVIYEIFIPSSQYTKSLTPRSKNKILKVSNDNIIEFRELKNNYKGSYPFIKEMNKRGLIGVDSTDIKDIQEGYIWNFDKFKPKIKVIEICELSEK